MSPETVPHESSPASSAHAVKVAIIYEDFASGLRAKDFAERLADELGCACLLADTMWRSDLLDYASIAAEATRATADSDYVVVSLRGDCQLSEAARKWIELQLAGAAQRGMALIVLSDSRQGKRRIVEETRQYLRTACSVKGVGYFSLTMTLPEEDALSQPGPAVRAAGFDSPSPHRLPALHAS